MAFDIRMPIGIYFTLIGGLLIVYGLVGDMPISGSDQLNVNLWWGLVLVVFGGFMLLLVRSAALSHMLRKLIRKG